MNNLKYHNSCRRLFTILIVFFEVKAASESGSCARESLAHVHVRCYKIVSTSIWMLSRSP
jgi:hypothetical protein